MSFFRLKRRIETLVRTIEKELEGPLKKDKEKRRASVGGNKRKASLDGAGAAAAGGGAKVRIDRMLLDADRHDTVAALAVSLPFDLTYLRLTAHSFALLNLSRRPRRSRRRAACRGEQIPENTLCIISNLHWQESKSHSAHRPATTAVCPPS